MLIYNKYGQPNNLPTLPITMIGSSSAGNSVRLDTLKLVVDLGFAFKHYPEKFFYHTKYIALTHEHGDHLNKATLRLLLDKFPHLEFIMPKRLFNVIHENQILSDVQFDKLTARTHIIDFQADDLTMTFDDFTIRPYETTHGDIFNVCYTFQTTNTPKPINIFYASDLDTLQGEIITDTHIVEGVPQSVNEPMFDIVLLEANYDETTVAEAEDAFGSNRHLSEQAAFKYLRTNLKTNGIFIPLHGSSRFGTYVQSPSDNVAN